MTTKILWNGLGVAALSLMIAACGPSETAGDNGDTNSTTNSSANGSNGTPNGMSGQNSSSARDGRTECGNDLMKINCEASQYCEDQNLMICTLGCLSDLNCTAAQECVKAAGENVGSCQTPSAGGNNTPSNGTPGNNTPSNNTPSNNTPSNNAPDNSAPGNNTPSNNTPSNNTPSNNAPAATCQEVCDAVIPDCDPLTSVAECVAVCNTDFTQAIRECILAEPTCADIEQNCFGGAPNNEPSNNTPGNNTPSNNTTPDGAIGSECSSNSRCDSGYCRKPAGAFDGTCAVNDFGQMCQFNNDCEYGACYFTDPGDAFGYCTATCESFTDCPTFWDCEEPSNASGKYCVDD